MQPKIKWRALLGLGAVYIAIIFNLWTLWGIVVLLWVLPDLRGGATHFLENVERRDNPVVYWLLILTWLGLGLFFIAIDLSPLLGGPDILLTHVDVLGVG